MVHMDKTFNYIAIFPPNIEIADDTLYAVMLDALLMGLLIPPIGIYQYWAHSTLRQRV